MCFVVSLKEVIKYRLSLLGQLRKNPEAKLLFSEKSKRGEKIQGRIVSCINQGSLVQILVETEHGLESIPFFFVDRF